MVVGGFLDSYNGFGGQDLETSGFLGFYNGIGFLGFYSGIGGQELETTVKTKKTTNTIFER